METQLENSCVLKECLSGRSVLSFDEESDTNSVVYNKNEVGESPRVMGESPRVVGESPRAMGELPRGKEKEEALPMSQDFVEDDNTRFGEKKEKKSVSMGERLKNVWTRLGDGEEKKKKENEEKKKKEEEKVSKFSMRLPMGKAKKEGEVQGGKKEGEEEKNGAEVERREGEEGSAEKEGEGQGVKKEGEAQGAKKEGEGQMAKKGKWEIDQRKGMQCQ